MPDQDKPRIINFLRAIYEAWISERPGQQAAALAYFGLFAIAPIIFVAFTVANLFLNQAVEFDQFFDRMAYAIGPEAADIIQNAVQALGDKTFGGSTVVTIIGFLSLLLAASGMFFQIQFALNRVFQAPLADRDQTKKFVLQRLLSFLMVLGVGLLVILAAIVNFVLTWFGSIIGEVAVLGKASVLLEWAGLFGLFVLAFGLLYKVLPNVEIAWRHVWPGAAVAALLEILAGMLLGVYFSLGSVGSAFEAAGTIAVILIAFNIFAQIFLFGALFSREYARWYGSGRYSEN